MNDFRHIGRNFVVVAHSRGGILARAAIVDAWLNNSFNLGQISGLSPCIARIKAAALRMPLLPYLTSLPSLMLWFNRTAQQNPP